MVNYAEVTLSPDELKKLQRIELEMLIEVDRICRKYDIKYSLDGGTLLGAVRHKGFIPWDDDIDVIMLREEYNKFFDACKKELDSKRFFLQDYRTDPYYIFGYEKIRRLGTEFIRLGQEHLKNKTGVFIDIFVADNVPDNLIMRKLHLFACFIIRKVLYSNIGKISEKNFFVRQWYKLLSLIPRDFSFYIRNVLANVCNRNRTELVRHMTHNYRISRYGMPRVCFDDFIELEFEKYKFKAFKNYDLYLTKLYGDYMVLPPKEEQKPHLKVSKIKLIDVEV